MLAARLGLGKSTVQRALSNSPLVSNDTKARVLAAAREAGYSGDPYFAALSAKRGRLTTKTVRLDHFHEPLSDVSARLGFDCHEVLRDCGRRSGYDVVRAPWRKGDTADAVAKMLWARGSAGFLFGRVTERSAKALIGFGRVPMVSLYRQAHLPVHTVRFDVAGAVRECWERLWAAGWRRIGCAVMRHAVEIEDDQDRLGAALELITTRLAVADRVPPLACGIRDHEAYFAWLRRYRPEAVIGFDAGLGVIHQNAGYRNVPYVTLHTSERRIMTAHIPGTSLPIHDWARQVIARMDLMIRHGETGQPDRPAHTVLPNLWVPGSGIPRRK